MIKRQSKEAQYLKLLGMTLVVTAVCVSDTGRKDGHALGIVSNAQVREVILGHIQQYSAQQYHDVIDWELALENLPSLEVNYQIAEYLQSSTQQNKAFLPLSENKIKHLHVLLERVVPRGIYVLELNLFRGYIKSSYSNVYVSLSNPSRAGPSTLSA